MGSTEGEKLKSFKNVFTNSRKMKIFAAVASVATAGVVGGENNPCPSNCWTWDANTASCTIAAGANATDCFEVTCNYDSMVVEVMPNLFGMSGNDTVFSNGAEWGTDSFTYNQPLGDAHRTIGINNSTDKLTVDVDFGLDMESVKVGDGNGTDVYLAPVSSKVTFTCEYPTVVNVASQNMTVNGATAVGTTSATGSLADGFSLSLWTDAARTDAVTATTISFVVDECSVESGGDSVSFIKDGCYSDTLGASFMTATNSTDNNFSFNSFTLGDAQNIQMNATVACTVVMCETSSCSKPASNADCPVVTGYNYVAP